MRIEVVLDETWKHTVAAAHTQQQARVATYVLLRAR